MTAAEDEKATLKRYLQRQRDAMVWKLDGLTEHDEAWWSGYRAKLQGIAESFPE